MVSDLAFGLVEHRLLVTTSTSWYQLVAWCQLILAVPAANSWYQPVPGATSWCQLFPGLQHFSCLPSLQLFLDSARCPDHKFLGSSQDWFRQPALSRIECCLLLIGDRWHVFEHWEFIVGHVGLRLRMIVRWMSLDTWTLDGLLGGDGCFLVDDRGPRNFCW